MDLRDKRFHFLALSGPTLIPGSEADSRCSTSISSILQKSCEKPNMVSRRPIKKLGQVSTLELTFHARHPIGPATGSISRLLSSSESFLSSAEPLMATAIRLLSFPLAPAVQSIQFWRTCTIHPRFAFQHGTRQPLRLASVAGNCVERSSLSLRTSKRTSFQIW